jgi:adenosylmethionine-8-amino-7-oxononanoate aminotransferase
MSPAPTSRDEVLAADRQHLWHPYTPMGEWIASGRPLVIDRAQGARLHDLDGRVYLDGNSSWWVALLGHNHPRLVRALRDQAERMCHVALAGITHEPAALLARDLCAVAPSGLTRAFFSDDGSTAVEVAAKMAVQYFRQTGRPGKRRLVALEGAYHGDTLGASSLGGVEAFRQAFGALLFDVVRVPSPAGGGADWAAAFAALERAIAGAADEIAAIFVEPIVQGAAGMRMYAAGWLTRLRALCTAHDVLLVADEVFTGYGRTGPMWACDHAGISPDLLCTAKGFSGGMLPMAATLATEAVFAGFLGGRQHAFLHGHSFTGNPLGAAVAREVLAVYRDEAILERAGEKALRLAALADRLASHIGREHCRSLGMIAAFDLGAAGYLGDIGWRVYDAALVRGAYLRPLGDTVYLAPPLTIDDADLERLCNILHDSVVACL